MLYKILQWVFVFGLSLGIFCSEAFANVSPKVAELNQGWSEQEIQFYNHASEGTNLAPLDFVLNLPDAKTPGSKFIDKLSSEYGFIPGQQSDNLNPYQLPVGLAIDERPVEFGDRPYLGITCAACHTRQLSYKDGSESWILPVHGGPALVDIPRFLEDLYGSLDALTQDDALMTTFAADVLQRPPTPEDLDSLRSEIGEVTGPYYLTDEIIEEMGVNKADFGPGNLNALSQGNYYNVALARWIKNKGLMRSSPDPLPIKFEGTVNYPPMWYAPRDTWAQWFAEIHHPSTRNWVQSVSTSPVRPPKMIEAFKKRAVVASIHFDNIEEIQESLERLRTPKWPEPVLGKLDPELIAKGKPLFESNCARCHTRTFEPPNSVGIKFKTRLAFDVGTDPVAYEQFAEDGAVRAAQLQKLSDKMLKFRKLKLLKEKKVGFRGARRYAKHDSRGRPNKFALAQESGYEGQYEEPYKGQYKGPDEMDNTDPAQKSRAVYWASPMQGIFASSPYFHNGSVPTLWDVLSPPEQRPKTFHTGSAEFDPERVGLKLDGPFTYDTREEGKGNGGHLFGTNFSSAQKTALIEYLKSL